MPLSRPELWRAVAACRFRPEGEIGSVLLQHERRDYMEFHRASECLTDYRRCLYLLALEPSLVLSVPSALQSIWKVHRADPDDFQSFVNIAPNIAKGSLQVSPVSLFGAAADKAARQRYLSEFDRLPSHRIWPTRKSVICHILLLLYGLLSMFVLPLVLIGTQDGGIKTMSLKGLLVMSALLSGTIAMLLSTAFGTWSFGRVRRAGDGDGYYIDLGDWGGSDGDAGGDGGGD